MPQNVVSAKSYNYCGIGAQVDARSRPDNLRRVGSARARLHLHLEEDVWDPPDPEIWDSARAVPKQKRFQVRV